MKFQKCSKSEALLEIGEVPRHAQDQTTISKMDWQSIIQFTRINVSDITK